MDEPWLRFEQLRWGGAPPSCVICGEAGRCAVLPGGPGARRRWRCASCRSQFSVLSGTLLEGTRLPLSSWRPLVDGLLVGDLGVRALARRLATTPETVRLVRAWLAAAAIRAGSEDALAALLRLEPDDVARVRAAVPRRGRPRVGASADYR